MRRRRFIQSLAIGAAAMFSGDPLIHAKELKTVGFPFDPITPSSDDELVLPRGFGYQVIRAWGDPVTAKERFGFNCDYTAFLPLHNVDSDEGLLWVNHEY